MERSWEEFIEKLECEEEEEDEFSHIRDDEEREWRRMKRLWDIHTTALYTLLQDIPEPLAPHFADLMPDVEEHLLGAEPAEYVPRVPELLTALDERIQNIIDNDPVLKWVIAMRDSLEEAQKDGLF
jgi:hypothetical protein